jgi:transposase/IS5 family transposase
VKSYRPYTPDQSFLLPPSPREWLPAGHLVFFIVEFVAQLDLKAIERRLQAADHRGERPYSPRMMTALLLYGYTRGVYSSRKLERAIVEDLAFRVLAGGEQPHFTTINQFRATHREALAGLFVQVLQACQSAGLVKLGHVAIDGTKMKANASKHKAMSHDRMVKDTARLRAEVDAWMARADAEDAADDELHGPYDAKEEIRLREERLAKMNAALEALKKETAAARARELRGQATELRRKAELPTTSPKKQGEFRTLAKKRENQASLFDDDDLDPPAGPDADLPRNSPPATKDGTPKPKAQRNFTDPDSRIMLRDGAFLQAYNGQIAVDEEHQIIVAAALSNQSPDAEYFEPMLRRVVESCGAVPERVTADSGYFSAANVRYAEHIGAEPFISTGKHRNDGAQIAGTARPNTTTPAKLAMRAALDTPLGRATYARRKCTVEPVFGQIRGRGFQHVSFRGLFKNRCEWLFVSLAHNVLKLFGALARQPALQPAG